MHTSYPIYHHDDQEFHGFLAYNASDSKKPKPCVLVAHDWSGCNDFARQKAIMLAEMGYVGFALDMYGNGKTGANTEEKKALIQPLLENRALLAARITAAFDCAAALAQVDAERMAAIGFCFGGLCVLDLARSGASLRGVVSFHGLLGKPNLAPKPIKAKVLALHGFEDPMVPPADLLAFCQEMTEGKVDWQVHQYGLTQHAFTNPEAHDQQMGTVFNPVAEQRSMQAMRNFFEETL